MTDPQLSPRKGIVSLVAFVIIIYPALAIMIKRLNDRDRPRYFAYIFIAPSVLTVLLMLFGAIDLVMIVSWLSLIIGIWALIELGFLKGTDGPNQHGPDPLG